MLKAGLIALIVALATFSSAHAGGRHHGPGYYGQGFAYTGGRHGYGHGYSRGYRYGRHHRRHHHNYGALAAGLLLGGVIVHSMNRPDVVRERVVYRRPIERRPARTEPVAVYEPVPAEPPPYYYRRDADGSCWLIERAEDGSETIIPQEPAVCG